MSPRFSLPQNRWFSTLVVIAVGLLAAACTSQAEPQSGLIIASSTEAPTPPPLPSVTPMPTRPNYDPGQLVEYTAQTGDTLPGLAGHFNTSVEEILEANPIIPQDVTTLPPGLPMQIPIYYLPYWGPQYQILPDSQFVNGPAAVGFDTREFIQQHPGWLRDYVGFAAGANRDAAGVIEYVAANFSVSPRLLLALVEFQAGGLSDPVLAPEQARYPLGHESYQHRGLYLQLVWAANTLNNGYYGWRTGQLTEFDLSDGRLVRPDPWQNAASVALQYYFNQVLTGDDYLRALGPDGLARTFADLFGDPWEAEEPHLAGSLVQPTFTLPFEAGTSWTFTGGPHTGWGNGAPFAALDFAPPAVVGGCKSSDRWATAIADGLVIRTEPGVAVLDLDEDGDERTGWVVFYLHLESRDKAQVGQQLKAGEPIGHPSCEGGTSTGTHVHVARKYNGEWLPAAGALPFVMEDWVPQAGSAPYQGSLTRFDRTVTACQCSNLASQITAQGPATENESTGSTGAQTP